MTKRLGFLLVAAVLMLLCGCSQSAEFDKNKEISAVSREDGSGTRGAFVDLFEIVLNGEGGTRKDRTTKEAIVAKQTDVIMTNVAADKYAIGYISLGSLGESVKAVSVDGIAVTSQTVKDGSYFAARPFYIATAGEISDVTADFISFILSAEGQAVVSESYIPIVDNAPHYQSTVASGKVTVAGSSSVTPVMEKLKEAYILLNPGVKIEIQLSDSSSGLQGAVDGTCDIAMASRNLKESEAEKLEEIKIALDGIAIIVNKENPVENLTKEQVFEIFTGEATTWSQLLG